MFGITIDGKHTYTDYGLRLKSYTLPMPEAKTSTIDIPYSDGSLDQTEITGEVFYKDRTGISFTFIQYDGNFKKYQAALQTLAAAIHGKKLKVILDNDPAYFYMMRLEINPSKSKMPLSTIVIEGTAEPFKYAMYKAGEDWLWDPFSFVDGVIYHLDNIVIDDDTKEIPITAATIYTVPQFTVTASTDLAVIFKGETYSMPAAGTYYFPQIRMAHETTKLEFTGAGTLSIDFRGRYL